MKTTPATFNLRQWYDLRGKGRLPLAFQYVPSAISVFDIMLTATCHRDETQSPLINRGLVISTHTSSSDLCFLSDESWNT